MCDTKADPYSFLGDGDECFNVDPIYKVYNGYCEDPGGNTNYDPPYQNMMSYWHHDPESFSSDQFNAMNNVIDNDGDIKGISSTNTFTLHDVSYDFGYLFRSAIRGLSTFSTVEFSGASQAGLYGNSVTLLPGFYAHPQIFTVQVRATDCNLGSKSFAQNKTSTNKIVTNKNLAENNVQKTGLIIYPNPAINYFMVTYSKATSFNAVLTVKNVQGVTVFKIQKSTITQLSEKVDLSNKAKGLYIVELFDGEKRLSAKVLVQ